ncbi:hypothetical protein PJI17_15385 [Mycobacterium kansasii]
MPPAAKPDGGARPGLRAVEAGTPSGGRSSMKEYRRQKLPRSAPTPSAGGGYDHDHGAGRGGGALPPRRT